MFTVKKQAQIASTQFELQVKRFLESASGKLEEFKTEHLESIEGPDGTYEIDITARFRILGAKFLVLVECKHHKNPVGRDYVQVLHAKQVSLGAQKAMLFSTSGFNEGAVTTRFYCFWSSLLQARLCTLQRVGILLPCLIPYPLMLAGSLPNTTAQVTA